MEEQAQSNKQEEYKQAIEADKWESEEYDLLKPTIDFGLDDFDIMGSYL